MSKVYEYYKELEAMCLIDNGPQHPSEMETEDGKVDEE